MLLFDPVTCPNPNDPIIISCFELLSALSALFPMLPALLLRYRMHSLRRLAGARNFRTTVLKWNYDQTAPN